MRIIHEYEFMTEDKRPQDLTLESLEGWTFLGSEYGGEYPDFMPQVIEATDAEGRSCKYVPIEVNGRVVDSKGFWFDNGHLPRHIATEGRDA